MNETQINLGKKYRHFKGKQYLILHIAKHSETLEDMVLYQALYGEREILVRPLSMFLGKKDIGDKFVNIFEEVIE